MFLLSFPGKRHGILNETQIEWKCDERKTGSEKWNEEKRLKSASVRQMRQRIYCGKSHTHTHQFTESLHAPSPILTRFPTPLPAPAPHNAKG